jgi:hypothetical protein
MFCIWKPDLDALKSEPWSIQNSELLRTFDFLRQQLAALALAV